MVEPVRVTRAALRRVTPIVAPKDMAKLPARVWSDEQWERIKLGYLAHDMDEKWDVFVEDDVAFLHRSWTGACTFEASFAPVDGGGRRITAGVVESDPSSYQRNSDRFDRVLLELVLSAIVLGEPAVELRAELVALSVPWFRRKRVPAGLIEHSVLGLRTPTGQDGTSG